MLLKDCHFSQHYSRAGHDERTASDWANPLHQPSFTSLPSQADFSLCHSGKNFDIGAAVAEQPALVSSQAGCQVLSQLPERAEGKTVSEHLLTNTAIHPLLHFDPLALSSPAIAAGLEHRQHEEHPLLNFDPLAETLSFLEGAVPPDASPEGSQLRLQSIAPPDFASELDYHSSPLASR